MSSVSRVNARKQVEKGFRTLFSSELTGGDGKEKISPQNRMLIVSSCHSSLAETCLDEIDQL